MSYFLSPNKKEKQEGEEEEEEEEEESDQTKVWIHDFCMDFWSWSMELY